MPSFDDIQLATDRLIMRPPRAGDLDAWTAMMLDEETARFLGGAIPRPLSWRQLMTVIGSWHAHGFAMFSVIEKSSGRWIGRLGPWQPDGWPGSEIGWAIVRDCWGRGYAAEGAAATTNWAFDVLGWSDVIHSIAPGNVASQRVAQKLGSRLLGPGRLPPPLADEEIEIWGQSREEWPALEELAVGGWQLAVGWRLAVGGSVNSEPLTRPQARDCQPNRQL
jgi:RimJ/RimL family protein N-acetyltransferase